MIKYLQTSIVILSCYSVFGCSSDNPASTETNNAQINDSSSIDEFVPSNNVEGNIYRSHAYGVKDKRYSS